jgi:hypothetical protein
MFPPYYIIKYITSDFLLENYKNPLNIGEISRGIYKNGYTWICFNSIDERAKGLDLLQKGLYDLQNNKYFKYKLYKSNCSYRCSLFYYCGYGFIDK